MGLGGFEPPTSPLSAVRSDQLSYKPARRGRPRREGKYRRVTPCRQDGWIAYDWPMPRPRTAQDASKPALRAVEVAAPGAAAAGAQLVWPGKFDEAGRRRRPQPREGRLEVVRTIGPAGGNRLVHGDFRAALASVPAGSVDFIYVDPPFRTDRDHYLRAGRNGGGAERQTAYADRWDEAAHLNFLDDLVALCRPALRETGSMAVHVDHRASAHARCLLDEHFGAERFINELIWKYGLGNATASRHFLRKHDAILVYGRTSRHYFKKQRGEVTEAQRRKYCHEDELGRYMMSYGKRYDFKGGKPLESVLDIPALAATDAQRCGYPTQKPLRLLEVLIESLCPPGGTVMDPCCGSGTTAVAAQRSGRNWIAIDESDAAIELATRRVEGEVRCGFVVQQILQAT